MVFHSQNKNTDILTHFKFVEQLILFANDLENLAKKIDKFPREKYLKYNSAIEKFKILDRFSNQNK
jgi:hypothetical protein